MKVSKATAESIASDFVGRSMTVRQIAIKHGICTRSVYNVAEKRGLTDNYHHRMVKQYTVMMSRDEIELVLLMFLDTDGMYEDKLARTAKMLEKRLLKSVENDYYDECVEKDARA